MPFGFGHPMGYTKGQVLFGFCRPDANPYNLRVNPYNRDTWLIYPTITPDRTPCKWYVFDGQDTRLRLTDELFFCPGSRVGLLLDLGAGTISVVQGRRVVGHAVMNGVTGPLLPCVRMRFRGQGIRVHGELPVPNIL